ncbi:Galactose oxidase, beta-propeller [Corchorus capsularis]|uniref:Galactose oxidase, beta-propeller n=1 Tax=Corchorus capsularis TaxID=210143 RepID=A0A1R3GPM8_COCAP|nr:Galactose oxidase, beta-propeller [Corchorus capsularis]
MSQSSFSNLPPPLLPMETTAKSIPPPPSLTMRRKQSMRRQVFTFFMSGCNRDVFVSLGMLSISKNAKEALWKSLDRCTPTGIFDPHVHKSLVYFNTLRPDDGWREAAPMISDRNLPTVIAGDGKIFAFGGLFPGPGLSPQPLVEVYDPRDNSWSPLPDYPCLMVPRVCMPVAVVHDKRILF